MFYYSHLYLDFFFIWQLVCSTNLSTISNSVIFDLHLAFALWIRVCVTRAINI